MSDDRDRRLPFAIPPIVDSAGLDPEDPDERSLLIRAAHPELDTELETVVVDGREMNPQLHLTMHEIVATQVADNDPPEVWETAQRLHRDGYHRHEILHMLASAMTPQLWSALHEQRGYDLDEHRVALAALPGSWERQRPGRPDPPAAQA
jgi:Domain of unknown function (DUF1841)